MSEIVVGIDDSAGAQDALAFAARVAESTGAALRLVSAFPYSDVPSRGANRTYREYLRADAQALLDRVAAGVEGVTTSTEAIADPSPPRALHAVVRADGVALVVVGSTRRGAGRPRACPGSTGERLLHGSPCPVAIVPRGYARGRSDRDRRRRLRRKRRVRGRARGGVPGGATLRCRPPRDPHLRRHASSARRPS